MVRVGIPRYEKNSNLRKKLTQKPRKTKEKEKNSERKKIKK
jgi:hypothetical protein